MWGNHVSTQSDGSTAERSVSASESARDQLPLIPVAAQGGDVVSLGAFHSGVDGWRGGDLVTVRRRSGDGRSSLSTGDSSGLELDIDGAVAATVSNEQDVRDADWVGHPYLTATISPGTIDETDAPMRARFRLVHAGGQQTSGRSVKPSSPRTRAHTGRGRGSNPHHGTLTSKTFTIPQNQPARLYWDLNSIDERVRSAVVRLDVICERADQPASAGPYRRGGAGGIRGSIHLGDAMLSDSPDTVATAKLQTHWQQLLSKCGTHVETVPEVKKSSVESGRFVFEDDDVEYAFEIQDDGSHLFTLGTTTYRFEDGMAGVERQ